MDIGHAYANLRAPDRRGKQPAGRGMRGDTQRNAPITSTIQSMNTRSRIGNCRCD